MPTVVALELQAIQAAKTQNWQAAIDANLAILQENNHDIGALIRLGVAYAQLGQQDEAKKAFLKVVDLDKSNQLAKKHLLKLKNHQSINLSTLPSDEQFIEEPGKTKTAELHRLASKEVLDSLSIGQVCELKPKNRYISVEAGKTYIGSLPEDLSARLTKLMKGGNKYTCYIRALSSGSCSIFIKETFRSKEHEYVNSFPPVKNQMATINDMFLVDENIPLQMEDIPPQIVVTDADEEKTLDHYQIEENIEETVPSEEVED